MAADFTEWQQNAISLQKQKRGLWKTTVSLEPGSYEYRFLVDGQWRDNPDCSMRVRSPFGTENCVRVVEQTVVLGIRPRPQGKMSRLRP